jgi:hypothetical protein
MKRHQYGVVVVKLILSINMFIRTQKRSEYVIHTNLLANCKNYLQRTAFTKIHILFINIHIQVN